MRWLPMPGCFGSLSCVLVTGMLACSGIPVRAEPPSDLTTLAWLAGHWVREEGGRRSEELWMPPTQNLIVGLNTTVVDGRTRGFEFLRIRLQEGRVDYVAMPGGRGETAFELVEHGERRVVFANPEHDFPQRILYWLDAEGRLHARIEGEEEGETKSFGWFWEKN